MSLLVTVRQQIVINQDSGEHHKVLVRENSSGKEVYHKVESCNLDASIEAGNYRLMEEEELEESAETCGHCW